MNQSIQSSPTRRRPAIAGNLVILLGKLVIVRNFISTSDRSLRIDDNSRLTFAQDDLRVARRLQS